MNEVLGGLTLRQRVRDEAAERMDRSQREFVLRQQLEAIRRELGEEDQAPTHDYRRRLEEIPLPEAVAEAVGRELDRLERMSEQSPEHSWILTWLDTVFELPWGKTTRDNLDLTAAREVLDEDHTGLERSNGKGAAAIIVTTQHDWCHGTIRIL